MQMAASAGIMEGDCQELEFDIGTGADLEFVSQSYDKIHEMKEGCARRTTKIRVHSVPPSAFTLSRRSLLKIPRLRAVWKSIWMTRRLCFP